MELYQLEYFNALVKYKHFSKAAEEINISQSAFSHGIKKLEEQLGVKLFTRNKQSVQLTPAGEEFIAHAHSILNEVQNAREAMLNYTNLYKGTLKIGAIQAISYQGITSILGAFQKTYPGINMEIFEDDSENLVKKFNALELNAIFINAHQLSDEYKPYAYPLVKDKMVFLVPKSHRLAAKKCVNLADLSEETFVMVSGFKSDFSRLCLSLGFRPNIISVGSHSVTIKKLAEENLGINPCTSCVAASLLSPMLKIVEFKPEFERTTYLIIKDETSINKIFKDYVLNNLK